MQTINKPASKWRVAFTWIGMVGLIIGITAFVVWRIQNRVADTEAIPTAFNSVFMLVVGGFGLLAGVAAYAVTIATDCFTFDFKRSVWPGLRGKIFLANIIVPLIPAM